MKALWSDLIGLFVDDGKLALAILLWIALVRLLPLPAKPILLFAGLATALIISTRQPTNQTNVKN